VITAPLSYPGRRSGANSPEGMSLRPPPTPVFTAPAESSA